MNILVVANTYPNNREPHYGSFVYNLIQELAKENTITVVSPFKVHNLLNKKKASYGEEKARVLRPFQLSFGDRKISGIDLNKVSSFCFKASVNRSLNKLLVKPDVIYCHFLVNCLPVLDYARDNAIPIVVASGESTYRDWERIDEKRRCQAKKLIKHIICVSQDNLDRLVELGFPNEMLTVIPNAVNIDLFKPLDQANCKQKLGIPSEKFVVGFVGHFIDRKGPNRVIQAIEMIDDSDIQLVCVGKGGELTKNKFTQVLEPIPNSWLPEIYNAFDVFVLPTLHEGHCNAIEEAKACGVPVVGSLGTSVEAQLNKDIGMLVPPLDIAAIAESIRLLKADPALRLRMKEELMKKKNIYCLSDRADNVRVILNRYI